MSEKKLTEVFEKMNTEEVDMISKGIDERPNEAREARVLARVYEKIENKQKSEEKTHTDAAQIIEPPAKISPFRRFALIAAAAVLTLVMFVPLASGMLQKSDDLPEATVEELSVGSFGSANEDADRILSDKSGLFYNGDSYYVASLSDLSLKKIIIPEDVCRTALPNYNTAVNTANAKVCVFYPENNKKAAISNNYAYLHCRAAVIADGIVKIGSNAFKKCSTLAGIYIPASVEVIEDGAFEGCINLKNIVIDKNNAVYKAEDGNILEKESGRIIFLNDGKQ